jgi:hypothetical protein
VQLSPRASIAFERLIRTIHKAVSFLRENQTSHGEFRTRRGERADLSDGVPESSIFTTAHALHALEHASDFGVEDLRAAGLRFLLEQKEDGDVWRYWSTRSARRTHAPPDADDTACSAFALRHARPDVFRGRNVETLLRWRSAEGLFLTWLEDPAPFGWPNDVDSVVNANVLLYLGDGAATEKVSAYLRGLVAESREALSYHYYSREIALHHALSRAYHHGCRSLGPMADTWTARVVRGIEEHGMGDELQAALALSTLLNTRATCTALLGRLAAFLCDSQHADGGWAARVYWHGSTAGGSVPTGYYGSEELVTAACVESLCHYRASVRERGGGA